MDELSLDSAFLKNDFIFEISHAGEVNESVISSLLQRIKISLNEHDVNKKELKSIYSVCVELIENILRHGKYNNLSSSLFGTIEFKIQDQNIYLEVSNYISIEDEQKLIHKFDKIKNRTIDEIKEIYRNELTNGVISERGGAGLGIYVMAIKSKKNYKLSLNSVDHLNVMYNIQVQFALSNI